MNQQKRVNQMLMSHGFAKLDDPGLIPQLGFVFKQVITDHEQFRDMLNRAAPDQRRNMYEALKPYLPFELKPLDVYLAELGAIADAKQLPTVAADGTLQPYKVSDIQTANRVLEAAAATKHLELTCASCTRFETYSGFDKRACVEKARAAGWIHNADADTETCPLCTPAVRLAA